MHSCVGCLGQHETLQGGRYHMSAKVLVSRVYPMAPLVDDRVLSEPCLISHSGNGTPLGHQAAPCAARVYQLVFLFCRCSRTVADMLTSYKVHRPHDFGSVGTSSGVKRISNQL